MHHQLTHKGMVILVSFTHSRISPKHVYNVQCAIWCHIGCILLQILHTHSKLLIVRKHALEQESRCTWTREQMHMDKRAGAHGQESRCTWTREQVHMDKRAGACGAIGCMLMLIFKPNATS